MRSPRAWSLASALSLSHRRPAAGGGVTAEGRGQNWVHVPAPNRKPCASVLLRARFVTFNRHLQPGVKKRARKCRSASFILSFAKDQSNCWMLCARAFMLLHGALTDSPLFDFRSLQSLGNYPRRLFHFSLTLPCFWNALRIWKWIVDFSNDLYFTNASTSRPLTKLAIPVVTVRAPSPLTTATREKLLRRRSRKFYL